MWLVATILDNTDMAFSVMEELIGQHHLRTFSVVHATEPMFSGWLSPPSPSGPLKRNHHLGPSDIYLDDLSSLDSENAALYFPQR